ncbi:hypothetical protein ABZU32_08470 [Sphaerisporangium sp. NPDC005288]|uniref:hypothetical protein n=1 Tax=Sphaerisporangium sp. NPDC005288 TaxID=3155114 RepID=UPI0033AE846E
MSVEDRVERARALYDRAVFGGDADALVSVERLLDAMEADLALARGKVLHARFVDRRGEESPDAAALTGAEEMALFERAVELYHGLGDVRGEAEALFWVGACHQVVLDDLQAAVVWFERSRALAAEAGDALTMSYALRHLGFAEHMAGRLEVARERLEESTRLRREAGFLPGVAANLVGLAYVAAGQERGDDALTLLDEASAIAEAAGAEAILRQIEEARTRL